MNKLTPVITDELLNRLDIYAENTRHNICYDGCISKKSSCYERIIEYYKIQRNTNNIPTVMTLATPTMLRIYSDNIITYTLEINGVIVGVMASQDLEYIFKKEIRTIKLNLLIDG